MTDPIETTLKRVQHECDKMRAVGLTTVQLNIETIEALIDHIATLEAGLDAARDRIHELMSLRRG